MAEGLDSSAKRGFAEPPCTPQSSHHRSLSHAGESPLQFHLKNRHTEQDEDEDSNESPSSRCFEELFCTRETPLPLAPLAGALMDASGPQGDVVKEGYLGKLNRSHRRYFVLRTGSHTGPSRLEWFKNQEKFTAMEMSAGKAAVFRTSKQGVIYLRCCLGVSRSGSSQKGHTVALYDKDQTLVLVMEEEQQQQEDWYLAIKRLMEEEQRDEEHEEGFDEDDDGYCTLPPAAFFKEVWPVMVKPRGLGSSKLFTGENRLCLTASTLVLVRLGSSNDLPSVTIPLLSVRRFGHLDGFFFLELGRSAPHGPGEIWMEAGEEGNPVLAQHIHESVRETVRSLRALPDFTRSLTSSPNQQPALLASKRRRPKQRDKPANVRTLTPRVLHPRNSENQTSPAQHHRRAQTPEDTKSEISLSFTSHLSPARPQQSPAPETKSRTMQSWESAEKEEGFGYMMMSPTVSHSLSELPQDDYVVMESPQKLNRPGYCSSSSSSSLQTSFSSSTCDSFSPLHPSRLQSSEIGRPCCPGTPENVPSPIETSFSAQPQQAQDFDRSLLIPPFLLSGSGTKKSPQSSPNVGTGQFSRPQPEQEQVRRHWLTACLLTCFQTGERY
ncbi:PREDICTED: insulin receptor substrate 2-B-like [Poecilia mexicana]|uniref:insulin receptor substrate 2-B-like n=1 Tax=Poecilia mexicana TaxID=48701 RepID=UPI00072DFEF1|nr:PREDICTED: insulin receptor substrate 2-B-like [Poecilia mexicana]